MPIFFIIRRKKYLKEEEMAPLNPVLPLVFLLLTTFYHLGEGREAHTFLVGGSANGWKVPESSDNKTLTHWAETQRFLVGDSLGTDLIFL